MARGRSQFITLALVGGLIGAALFGALALVPRPASKPEFDGTLMDPPLSAPDFVLTDQHGQLFQLSDVQGKVVVLTFLYTSCEDVCPFIGAKLRSATEILGGLANEVELVVVTTDPERDTPERATEYSRTLGMLDSWRYLNGDPTELQAVWQGYFIGPQRSDESHAEVSIETLTDYGLLNGLTDQDIESALQTIELYGGGYDVGHSTPVWLIDKSGQILVLHGQDFLPSELVHDIQILLESSP